MQGHKGQLFQPQAINPLHIIGEPLFLPSPPQLPSGSSALKEPSSGLQRRSSLKVRSLYSPYPKGSSKQSIQKSTQDISPKQSVQWSDPLSTIRTIPARETFGSPQPIENRAPTPFSTVSNSAVQPIASGSGYTHSKNSTFESLSISSTISKNESSLSGDATIIDIGPARAYQNASTALIPPFTKPRAPASLTGANQLRHNLRHLRNAAQPVATVIRPEAELPNTLTTAVPQGGRSQSAIHLSTPIAQTTVSTTPSRTTPPPTTIFQPIPIAAPIPRPTCISTPNASPSSINEATSAKILVSSQNIPKRQQEPDDLRLPLKRRPSTPDISRRPFKANKTDENLIAASTSNSHTSHFPSLDNLGTALTQVDGERQVLPNIRPVDHSTSHLGTDNFKNAGNLLIRTPTTSKNNDDSGDDDTLFGDGDVRMEPPSSTGTGEVTGPGHGLDHHGPFLVSQPTSKAKAKLDQRRRPLTHVKAIEWKNDLERFSYLDDINKMDFRLDDEFYQLLKIIDAEKDNPYLTPTNLKKTGLGKLMKDLSKRDCFDERSSKMAKRIYRFWRQLCLDT